MNLFFVAAAVLLTLIGLVHSVMGERLIFRRMRCGALIPTNGGKVLREPHVRIVWVSWHLVTLFGSVLAVALLWLALPENLAMLRSPLSLSIGVSVVAAALLVFVGTKGKHLGWAGLLGVALLIGAGLLA